MPWAAIAPSSGAGAGDDSPMNDRPDSATTRPPTSRLAATTIVERTPGR